MITNRNTKQKIIAVLTAVIIACTMYMPISIFAAEAPQDQEPPVVEEQAEEQNDKEQPAAEKDNDAQKQDSAESDEQEVESVESQEAETVAVDSDGKTSDEDPAEESDEEQPGALTLTNDDTPYLVKVTCGKGAERAITRLLKQNGTTSAKNDLRASTTKIILKDGITGIGWTALYDGSGYEPLYSDEYTVNRDETGIFQDFAKLETVETCSSIERIGWSAFRRCNALTSFDFSKLTNLKEIMNQAFSPCGLTSVDLSACTKLKTIYASVFNTNSDLTSIVLPEGLEVLGSNEFYLNPAKNTPTSASGGMNPLQTASLSQSTVECRTKH